MTENVPPRGAGRSTAAVATIALGLVFLLKAMLGPEHPSGPLFILIPASTLLAFGATHRSPAGVSSVTAGLTLILITVVLVFDIRWGATWPAFVVIAGIAALLRSRP